MLYSINNLRPAPLPFRIQLANGFTRTDPTTFNAEELASAGYVGPFTEPNYDPATERLLWINGAYVIEQLPPPPPPPPPQPQWALFSDAIYGSQELKNAMASASTFLQVRLGVGLGLSRSGLAEDIESFALAWEDAVTEGLISQQLAAGFLQLAQQFNLPAAFIARLQGDS